MATRTAIHLCSGYGGFELALRNHGVRTVAHVERDAYAAATLVARMAEAQLDHAPIWDDLTTFDGRPWRGRVDLITAGFPCQPFSSAGQRRGLDDDRWLWPAIARIVAEIRPRYVFLENVPGVVRAGLPAVLHSLAQLGFDAEWGLLSAAAVGAPHKRERWWCLAHATGDGSPTLVSAGHSRPDATRSGDRPGERPDVADADGVSRHQGQRPATRRRGTLTQDPRHPFPPRPDDHDGWAEWLNQGRPQPGLRRSTHGAPTWLADALHLGGNGLVPQCANEAWTQLHQRIEEP